MAGTQSDRDTEGAAEGIPEVRAFRALADENRLRALMALRDQELCVCQLVELLQLAHSTVSKHMSVLRDAGLVQSRKSGRWVYYRLRSDGGSGLPGAALDVILSAAVKGKQAGRDTRKLREILKLDPECLSERQRRF